jgi:cytochrome bd-type quinol oxidase subunit 2
LRSVFSSHGERYVAHNPGSSYAILAMLALTAVVAATGLLLSTGSEAAEELHALAAYGLMAVAAVHVLGVLWHTIRHRENITRSMITGSREGQPDEEIASSRPIAAMAFVAVMTYLGVGLFRNLDESRHETTVPGLGITIQLGEGEDHERGGDERD